MSETNFNNQFSSLNPIEDDGKELDSTIDRAEYFKSLNEENKKLQNILIGISDHAKMTNQSVIKSGIYQLIAGDALNKGKFKYAFEWKSLPDSDNGIYNIPYFGDFIPSFQIYNPYDTSFEIELRVQFEYYKLISDDEDYLLIGKYKLEKGNNNIIPVYGTPGLVVNKLYGRFYFKSDKNITINTMWGFASTNTPWYDAKVSRSRFMFVGPQGDAFECSLDKGLVKIE